MINIYVQKFNQQNILEQLLIKRPENPIKFIIEILKRENENGMLYV